MSGIVSAAIGVASAVASLFIGNMPVVFSGPGIIPFAFRSFEVPEYIEMGGKQALTTHKFPGGNRVIDSMGRNDDNYHWSGTILSIDAWLRVQQLDQLRIAGQALRLTIGPMAFNVVIESFEYKVKKPTLYEYSISVVVLSIPLPGPFQQTTLLGSMTSQLGAAIGINLPAVLAPVGAALGAIAPVLGAASSLVAGAQSIVPVLGAVVGAQAVVSGLALASTASLAGAALTLAAVAGPGVAYRAIGALGVASVAINSAVALNQVGNNLSVMASGLTGSLKT